MKSRHKKYFRSFFYTINGLTIFISTILLIYGESRRFYRIADNKYVTVWKTFNNVCYISPGKYYGLWKPSEGYIKTTNEYSIIFFWTPEMPDTFVIRPDLGVQINNSKKKEGIFIDYNEDVKKFDKLFYKPNAKYVYDLNDDAQLLILSIKEQYALDKNKTKL